MTDDGIYYVLEPTLSQDHGPNHKEKIYNDIRLNYKKDGIKNKVFNFAEAKCIINIPHIVRIQNKKRRRRRVYLDSQATQGSAKKSPSRQGTPGRATSPRKFDSKSPDKMKNKTSPRKEGPQSPSTSTQQGTADVKSLEDITKLSLPQPD